MLKTLPVLLFALLFTSCKVDPENQDNIFYIIGTHTNFIKSKRFKNIPPPPPSYVVYCDLNFILLGKNTIYFHEVSHLHRCGFGKATSDYIKIPFVNLIPEKIQKIDSANLLSFIDSVSAKKWNGYSDLFISISTPADTIRNPGFELICEFILKKSNFRYTIRKTTTEEGYAINAKLNGKNYSSSEAFFELKMDSSLVCKRN